MTTLENVNLTGQFLIAMPGMTDPYFSKTVTFICTHNQDGAMGVIINRPIDLNIGSLFKQLKLEIAVSPWLETSLFFGGPVQPDRGFILHKPHHEYDSTLAINPQISLTTSRDILEATATNNGPTQMLIALGYAGWSAGQLEEEMARNAWLSLEVTQAEILNHLIFDIPYEEKFAHAMGLMGLNLANLSKMAGHA